MLAPTASVRPGALVRHPVAIAALLVLLLNDHVLKVAAPGFVTGKLSDIAGLALFPILVVAVVELASSSVGRQSDRRSIAVMAAILTGVTFAAIKLVPAVASPVGLFLGGLQWLALGGPFAGSDPWSTTFAADATDLLALPAVLVAWLLVPRRPARVHPVDRRDVGGLPRSPGRGGFALLLVGSLATLATSQAPAMVSSELSMPIERDDTPGPEARYVEFSIDTDDPNVGSVRLDASAWSEVSANEFTAIAVGDVGITIIADALPAISVENWWTGSALDLTEPCRSGCTGGAWIVVDRITAEGGNPFALQAGVVVESMLIGPDETIGAEVSLTEVPDRVPTEVPVRIAGTASGLVVLTPDDAIQTTEIRLTIRKEALTAPTSFPLVGRLRADLLVGRPYGTSALLTIADDPEPRGQQETSIDVDLLSRCAPEQDCILDLEIEQALLLDTWGVDVDGDGDVDQPPDTEVPWTLDASLIAFDGRELPSDAITFDVSE